MNKINRYFYVKWEDAEGIEYKVAILARINGIYYFKYNNSIFNNHNFAGIPSFKENILYRSKNELFEFFQKRILKPKQNIENFDEMDMLKTSLGKSQTDSFSVEIIPRKDREKIEKIIKDLETLELNKLAENRDSLL